MKKSVLVLSLCIILGMTSMVHAVLTDLSISSLRQDGMGGAGLTLSKDVYSLPLNPAGLTQAKRKLYLPLGLSIGASDDVFKSISKLSATGTDAQRIANIESLVPSNLAFSLGWQPLAYTDTNWGVAVLNGSFINGEVANPAQPHLEIQGYSDIVLAAGLAQPFTIGSQSFSAGISTKYVFRNRLLDSRTNDGLINKSISDFVSGGNNVVTKNVSSVTVSGLSFDLGLNTTVFDGQFGVVLNNIGGALSGTYSTTRNASVSYQEMLPFYLAIGYSREVDPESIPWVGRFIGKFDTAIDYKFQSSNVYKNISMGLEKRVFSDVVALRMGLHQGLPTFGLGLDFYLLRIQYAYTSQELSDILGEQTVSMHRVEINLPLY